MAEAVLVGPSSALLEAGELTEGLVDGVSVSGRSMTGAALGWDMSGLFPVWRWVLRAR